MESHISRRNLLRLAGGAGAATAAASLPGSTAMQTAAQSEDSLPNFEGTNLTAVLIGGGSYEKLYTLLEDWEQATGADIDTSTRLAHGEMNDKLLREYAGGSPSFNWASDHSGPWPQWQAALEPLDGYVDQENLGDFTPSVLEFCKAVDDGQVYLMPRHVDMQLMYYRKDLIEDPAEQADFKSRYGYELRPPADWKEWEDVAEFFTRPPELYGYAAVGYWDFAGLLSSAGGLLLDEQNRPAWNTEAGKAALSHMVELFVVRKTVPEGTVQYGWDDVTQLFRTGRTAFYFEWPGWYEQLKDPGESDVVGKFGVAKLPYGPAGPDKMRSQGGIHGFTIARESDDKDASYSAIDFITSPDAEYFEFVEGGFLPARTSVWERARTHVAEQGDELDRERLALLEESIAQNFWLPPNREVPQWASVFAETLRPAIERALLGEVDVDEALEESSAAAEVMLCDLGAVD